MGVPDGRVLLAPLHQAQTDDHQPHNMLPSALVRRMAAGYAPHVREVNAAKLGGQAQLLLR